MYNKEAVYKYRRTKKGLISLIYATQKNSCKKRSHVFPNYTKKQLSDWIFSNEKFDTLFKEWENNYYLADLKPSVDRIDDYKGYSLDNIQLMTWRENREKGHNDRKNGTNNKQSRAVVQFKKDGTIVKEWYSMHEAQRNGFCNSHICSCCKGKRKTHKGFVWRYKVIA